MTTETLKTASAPLWVDGKEKVLVGTNEPKTMLITGSVWVELAFGEPHTLEDDDGD